MLTGFRFTRSARLTTPSHYQRVFRGRNIKVSNHHWVVLAVLQQEDAATTAGTELPGSARLGMAIAKKRARLAPERNRQKRVIRESFRHNRHRLQRMDIVVMNRDSCPQASNDQLRSSLEQLWDKLLVKSNR